MGNLYYKSDIISRIPILGQNIIRNGDFRLAQRGTSLTQGGGTSVDYNLDRWKVFNTTDATFTMSQEEDSPTYIQSGFQTDYCVQMTPTIVDTPLVSGEYFLLSQPVEDSEMQSHINNGTGLFTLSFWLKATKTGVTCVRVIMYGAGLKILKEFTVSSSNTWEKHTWTFEMPHTTDWGGLGVNFCLGNGGPYDSPTDTWTNLSYHSTSNQVNHLDNVSNIFKLAQVQLEAGDTATPFKGISFWDELRLAQTHFCKTYDVDVAPGSTTSDGRQEGLVSGTSFTSVTVSFPTEMRVVPTVALYDNVGNSGAVTEGNLGNNQAATAGYVGQRGFGFLNKGGGSNWTAGEWMDFHYTADASN